MSERPRDAKDLESATELLKGSTDYRVLRRLDSISEYSDLDEKATKRGLILDIETTGLNPNDDRIIEIGMVSFAYGAEDGAVGMVDPPVAFFEDPEQELTRKIIDLTGITDDMVRGQRIDDDLVREQFMAADIAIAHNASFDRPFVDRRFGFLAGQPWACSYREVPWEDHGHRCLKLECLLTNHCSYFFDGHRAANDCLALLRLLATPFQSGESPMKLLLESARKETVRISAVGAPFSAKDVLKERGYRWNSGEDSDPKAWWCEVPAAEKEAELEWLKEYGYDGRDASWELQTRDAKSRYTS
jgi:DNA polymerase III subunit epsilon